jgi:hypothetical protein
VAPSVGDPCRRSCSIDPSLRPRRTIPVVGLVQVVVQAHHRPRLLLGPVALRHLPPEREPAPPVRLDEPALARPRGRRDRTTHHVSDDVEEALISSGIGRFPLVSAPGSGLEVARSQLRKYRSSGDPSPHPRGPPRRPITSSWSPPSWTSPQPCTRPRPGTPPSGGEPVAPGPDATRPPTNLGAARHGEGTAHGLRWCSPRTLTQKCAGPGDARASWSSCWAGATAHQRGDPARQRHRKLGQEKPTGSPSSVARHHRHPPVANRLDEPPVNRAGLEASHLTPEPRSTDIPLAAPPPRLRGPSGLGPPPGLGLHDAIRLDLGVGVRRVVVGQQDQTWRAPASAGHPHGERRGRVAPLRPWWRTPPRCTGRRAAPGRRPSHSSRTGLSEIVLDGRPGAWWSGRCRPCARPSASTRKPSVWPLWGTGRAVTLAHPPDGEVLGPRDVLISDQLAPELGHARSGRRGGLHQAASSASQQRAALWPGRARARSRPAPRGPAWGPKKGTPSTWSKCRWVEQGGRVQGGPDGPRRLEQHVAQGPQPPSPRSTNERLLVPLDLHHEPQEVFPPYRR